MVKNVISSTWVKSFPSICGKGTSWLSNGRKDLSLSVHHGFHAQAHCTSQRGPLRHQLPWFPQAWLLGSGCQQKGYALAQGLFRTKQFRPRLSENKGEAELRVCSFTMNAPFFFLKQRPSFALLCPYLIYYGHNLAYLVLLTKIYHFFQDKNLLILEWKGFWSEIPQLVILQWRFRKPSLVT